MSLSSTDAGPHAGLALPSDSAPTSNIDGDNKVDDRFNAAVLRPHVLVVDDESLIADSVVTILNRNGYDAVARYAALEAIHYVQEYGPDIVIADVILPDLDGVRLAMAVRALCPAMRIVLFSGSGDTVPLVELASNDGLSFELLAKPVHPAQLLKALKAQPNA
jgi:DNA-binding response OmpR family regulator